MYQDTEAGYRFGYICKNNGGDHLMIKATIPLVDAEIADLFN